jgi:hypothetical protein
MTDVGDGHGLGNVTNVGTGNDTYRNYIGTISKLAQRTWPAATGVALMNVGFWSHPLTIAYFSKLTPLKWGYLFAGAVIRTTAATFAGARADLPGGEVTLSSVNLLTALIADQMGGDSYPKALRFAQGSAQSGARIFGAHVVRFAWTGLIDLAGMGVYHANEWLYDSMHLSPDEFIKKHAGLTAGQELGDRMTVLLIGTASGSVVKGVLSSLGPNFVNPELMKNVWPADIARCAVGRYTARSGFASLRHNITMAQALNDGTEGMIFDCIYSIGLHQWYRPERTLQTFMNAVFQH